MPYYPPPATGGSLAVQDEGIAQGSATTMNFTGAGVTATVGGGTATVNIPGGAGTGASGNATVNFGTVPGSSMAKVTVTGQTGIVSGSNIEVWIQDNDSTADHNSAEHALAGLVLTGGNIVAGTGFDIIARSTLRLTGSFKVRWEWQ